jgi:2-oxo-4-hydroxy-4-carboxy-5-ureidoimidazoline decarboxylase
MIAAVNRLDRDAFIAALGPVCENSPWVIERCWARRPFADLPALHAAIMATVYEAARDKQLAFLRAHPDLAGKAARAGTVTADSRAEQSSAGLDRLDDEEYARFERLNQAYRQKFGFPFIIAVRDHTKASILAAFERRLGHDEEGEIAAALDQVARIILHRLERSFASCA